MTFVFLIAHSLSYCTSSTTYMFSCTQHKQDRLKVFLRLTPLGPVTSFSALSTSRSSYKKRFPALNTSRTGYKFSRAYNQQDWLQLFLRLAPVRPVTSFTALGTSRTGFKFSCAWHQEDWLQFFLHLAPIAFLFLASVFFFFC